MNLDELSDSELLKMRICDLPISFEESPFFELKSKLLKDLERKGIVFKPKIWISDDWFCPDGVTGFAMPFFLMHPRLIELERKMMGIVEGESKSWFMKLLRHECGHAVDNAYFLKDCKQRIRLFGDHAVEYPDSYEAKKFSKKFVQHLEDGYAQAHPEEDWAETFALWLTPRSAWKKNYENWPAIKKLEYIDKRMKSIKGSSPNVICYQKVDELETLDISLRTYYNRKRDRFLLNSCESHLNRFLVSRTRSKKDTRDLYEELKKNRNSLKKYLAKSLDQKNYQVEGILSDLECLAKNKGLTIKKGKPKKELQGLVSAHARRFFKEGKHRTIM